MGSCLSRIGRVGQQRLPSGGGGGGPQDHGAVAAARNAERSSIPGESCSQRTAHTTRTPHHNAAHETHTHTHTCNRYAVEGSCLSEGVVEGGGMTWSGLPHPLAVLTYPPHHLTLTLTPHSGVPCAWPAACLCVGSSAIPPAPAPTDRLFATRHWPNQRRHGRSTRPRCALSLSSLCLSSPTCRCVPPSRSPLSPFTATLHPHTRTSGRTLLCILHAPHTHKSFRRLGHVHR